MHLSAHRKRWDVKITRPTKGQPVADRTATAIWTALSRIDAKIFLWNVFPLHPHESEEEFTNRAHNADEREKGKDLLKQLIGMLKRSRLVAIGNDAKLIDRSANRRSATDQSQES